MTRSQARRVAVTVGRYYESSAAGTTRSDPCFSSMVDVLIVGAGPTGLAAALFLTDRGIGVRIVDAAAGPATTSRAQVVNPRSLELLESAGVAATVVHEGRRADGVRFTEGWNPVARLDFTDLPSRFAMTVIPQARTEALLTAALQARGVGVERQTRFESLTQDEAGVSAVLAGPDGGRETADARLLFVADGAHSAVRTALGISFDGRGFPETWPLYDIELDDPLDTAFAHVEFVREGLLFMLCIRPGLWRVFSNFDSPLLHLPPGSTAGAVLWESSFHIADRVAGQAAIGRVALGGDAAHIHSPIGARGMNLGIEDAYVFAGCAADALTGRADRIGDYGHLRHAVHERVVARMDKLTALVRGQPAWVSVVRDYLIPGMTGFGPVARAMRDFMTGLDHPVRMDSGPNPTEASVRSAESAREING